MNKPTRRVGLGTAVLISAALFAFSMPNKSLALERTLLARSSKLGIDVYVVSQTKSWCASVVTVNVDSDDPSVYRSPDFESLVPKIGSLVADQCSRAFEILIQAYDRNRGQLVLKGVAIAKDDWALQVLE